MNTKQYKLLNKWYRFEVDMTVTDTGISKWEDQLNNDDPLLGLDDTSWWKPQDDELQQQENESEMGK